MRVCTDRSYGLREDSLLHVSFSRSESGESLLSLMDTADGPVDGMLKHALMAGQPVERPLHVIIENCFLDVGKIFAVEIFESLHFLDK